jgi:hypothetical protein
MTDRPKLHGVDTSLSRHFRPIETIATLRRRSPIIDEAKDVGLKESQIPGR